jgi:hypothetical protein
LVENIGSNGRSENWSFPIGKSKIVFTVDACLLLTGVYSLEIVIVSCRGDRIDRLPNAAKVSVITSKQEIVDQTALSGLMHSPGVWSYVCPAIHPSNSMT